MKTLTAIGLKDIDFDLLIENGYEIVGKDIIYQEGIFEALEIYKSTEAIIISDYLPGELSFEEFIKKIVKKYDKIDITVFLEQDDYNKIVFLNSYGIYKVYSINSYTQELKKKINSGNNSEFKEKLKSRINNNINSNSLNHIENTSNSTIIATSGINGGGKTIISCLLARKLADKGKTLIIDMDNCTNDVNTITGQCGDFIKYKYFDIKNFSYLTSFENSEFDKETKKIQFYKFFENAKNLYDYIIIDGEKNETNIQKMIFEYADIIIFVVEPNLVCLKKAKNIIDKFEEIENDKLKIILNKSNRYSIKYNLIEKIFYNNEIIGNIKYTEQIENVINKNFNKKIEIAEIDEIIYKIKKGEKIWNY